MSAGRCGGARALTALLALASAGGLSWPVTTPGSGEMDGWTTELDDDGMVISSREAPGASVHEVRVVADVDAPPRAVRNVIADHEGAPETLPRVAEARVVAREGHVAWVYERLDVPVLHDRDCTTRVEEEEIEGVPGGYRIRFEGSPDRGPPPRRGVVRIGLIRGAWEFLPVDGGARTRVTYTVLIDPGGIIPGFVADLAARSAVPDVIRALRRWAASPRYAGAG
jgi:hypothetical protein